MKVSQLKKIIRECIEEELEEGLGDSIKKRYHLINRDRNFRAAEDAERATNKAFFSKDKDGHKIYNDGELKASLNLSKSDEKWRKGHDHAKKAYAIHSKQQKEKIKEARSHGGQSIKKGKAQGFRKNTLYGANDRLKRRMDITEPYGPKDKQRFNKASMKIDKTYPPEKPYYIDSKGRERWATPRGSIKNLSKSEAGIFLNNYIKGRK